MTSHRRAADPSPIARRPAPEEDLRSPEGSPARAAPSASSAAIGSAGGDEASQYVAPFELTPSNAPAGAPPAAKVVLNLPSANDDGTDARSRRRAATVRVDRPDIGNREELAAQYGLTTPLPGATTVRTERPLAPPPVAAGAPATVPTRRYPTPGASGLSPFAVTILSLLATLAVLALLLALALRLGWFTL